jgi:hypothetical protein
MLNSRILILKVVWIRLSSFSRDRIVYLLRKRRRCKHWGILMGPARQLRNEDENGMIMMMVYCN